MHAEWSAFLQIASSTSWTGQHAQKQQYALFMEFQLLRKMWRRSMSHNSSISGTGEPVQAIRVINEKWLLLIMVGNNIIFSCGEEYVKLVWEFICKPGRENLDFFQVKISEMTGKTKKYCMYWSPLYPGKTLLKSKGGSIRFSDIQKYLTWLKLQECKQFSWF